MVFNDTGNKTGLIQDCEMTLFGDNGYGKISSVTDRLYNFTNLLNRALDKVTTLIMSCDGRWEFDNSNYTDLPIATTTLVNNQQDYSLSVSHLKILRVEVLGPDNKYYRVDPINQSDVKILGMTEFENGIGSPQYYDLVGNSIFLYPKPQTGYVTMTAGLKVYYQREPSYFVYSDTVKTPGINILFHRLVSRWACFDYAIDRQLPIKNDVSNQVMLLEQELKDFYASRDADDKIRFRTYQHNWQYNVRIK